MATIHQAIYGDKSGAYALLKTSLDNIELAKRICNVTDLLDRPANDQLIGPVFRSFAFQSQYLFIKSFPDNNPTVRKGRVLSHVLIVEQEDLSEINRLDYLFSFFLENLEKNPELTPIIYNDATLKSLSVIHSPSREGAAINGLLDHSSFNNTLLWVGENGYHDFVAKIWSQLDGKLRERLKLGVGFNPQHLNNKTLNILYVLDGYETKWRTGNYCIIGKNDEAELQSISAFFLSGDKVKSQSLGHFLKKFKITPIDIEDYRYLETVIPAYESLSQNTDFKSLIILCDLVSKYSPNPQIAAQEKENILKFVLSRIKTANGEQIIILKNTGWEGFSGAKLLIEKEIDEWIKSTLFSSKIDKFSTKVIATAFDSSNEVLWWKKAFLDSFKGVLKKWKKPYAKCIWHWISEDESLMKSLDSFIPDTKQVEMDFVESWPTPKKGLAAILEVFSEKRKWLIVHGLSLLQLYSSKEAIEKQIRVDANPAHLEALERMSALINAADFLQLTIKIGEKRLIKIAASSLNSNPTLLRNFNVKQPIWRQIWLQSFGNGKKIWDGIKKPLNVLHELFEELLNGVVIEDALLIALSKSEYNDLSTFKRRPEVWRNLNVDSKKGFLNATTSGCIKLLNKKKINEADIEHDIWDNLSDVSVVKNIFGEREITTATKIRLFEYSSSLREKELLILLDVSRFSSQESTRLGRLILQKSWSDAARFISNRVSARHDLRLALIECRTLLGFFERVALSYSGYLREVISPEEWWEAFTVQSYKIYPAGPTDLGLWGRAGGKDFDLVSKGTGKEIWVDALKKIQNKRSNLDIRRLLHEMLEDYPNNAELKQLSETFPR